MNRPAGVLREDFASDNHASAHPAVLAAITAVSRGPASAYGGDRWTAAAEASLRDLAGPTAVPLLLFNGTAANVLGLSVLLGPGDAIICAENAHFAVDECGAVEAVLGRKLLLAPAPHGKLTPAAIEAVLERCTDVRTPRPSTVAITQATELGTCYALRELEAMREVCDRKGLRLYIDGARLANAVAHLGCKVEDIARFADALSFGFTKNGALGADALLLMSSDIAERAPYLRRQQGQLASKMRFLAAQISALLDDELWLDNARHANGMATRLAADLDRLPGLRLTQPVQSNAVFVELPPAATNSLRERWTFHLQPAGVTRLMTSHATGQADVSDLVAEVGASLK
ncbi:L-threonine aldolase [Streptomyces puniciscabiei]|uniref:L-threonine aldolase n=1 Tax=Streptomyces puniciscabiei TaxID=164348 RepID=A0A542UCI0_9ACTN|nr:aminotransferase class I/II-fold pyridoxal phosphate-dependent enzyme [Streptomyces puniciscabiei]TQK96787.1 L-threonine aldolase [Streptomyces puniciscabiei]